MHDYEDMEMESQLFPWLDDPGEEVMEYLESEPDDYEWDREEER